MKRVLLAVLALGTLAAPLAVTSAQAQVPPRNGPYGDRDRDGIPNAYDNRNNNRGAWGDRDHDGIPNAYDQRNNNRSGMRDKDHDGVPQAWDRNDRNPYRQ